MEQSTDDLAAVASDAVRASGDYLREAFRNGAVDGEYDTTDVKAVADREAQRQVRSVIDSHYPDHAFDGEESEWSDSDHAYRWVVDPLDGTNNFASGYPKFATAAAVLHNDEPVVAAIYEPLTGTQYLARRGEGTTVDGRPIRVTDGSTHPLEHGTVALVIGLPAVTNSALAQQAETLELALRDQCKRVVATWAPCVDWGLLARGAIDGLVAFHPERYEQYAGSLLAAESAVKAVDTVDDDGLYVGAPNSETTQRLHETVMDSL
ncbi:myo-inositol-1(or 4)-monophosphatase [Halohasta litchfieldiae]|jgi:myo-inositol-1(or 4)-monophosphatase|uniref:fructose-bisphosphatase n=1 Tax=Halohasta litchfieldiae TaxID=1073996 RepID=A0A1H6T7T9_9EURY|nr:inositol monophosphatase [Halohasta litchfieldiae]ATW87675.1 myo-inositol-1(or 4)-monophosphatase [Halohasta litchfieldiae]SEI76163.1 myo-inositol-1(or 4)-monophosphatase [Halohasta litchfieldiae]